MDDIGELFSQEHQSIDVGDRRAFRTRKTSSEFKQQLE